jgi:hypothetical protein
MVDILRETDAWSDTNRRLWRLPIGLRSSDLLWDSCTQSGLPLLLNIPTIFRSVGLRNVLTSPNAECPLLGREIGEAKVRNGSIVLGRAGA